MFDGFLGSRASVMLDVVSVGMAVVLVFSYAKINFKLLAFFFAR